MSRRAGSANLANVTLAVVIPRHVNAPAARWRKLAIPTALFGGVRIGDRGSKNDRLREAAVGDDTNLARARCFIAIREINPAARIDRFVRINDLAHPARATQ